MEKLTREQITFIDNYLLHSGVNYVDIRYEMIDHVATALEQSDDDFYSAFKEYMLQHKKELLQSNGQFAKAAAKRAGKIILVNLLKPVPLMVFVLVFLVFKTLAHYIPHSQLLEIYSFSYLFMMTAALLNYKYFSPVHHKYSVIDKLKAILLTFLYVVFVIIKPERLTDNINILIIYYAAIYAFFAGSTMAYLNLLNKYKFQYNEQ